MQQDRKGFSFIELLIVAVVVVTVIREIVIPNFF
ncbi:MAG: prepilin-type N-terminal cleavage/methylation domain-containing protein [Acidobacteria bacterium]|nr:prepilin-type N-terminal cleavage/methylation domain-containing protein [Acidobacteriota bacterium]